MSDYNPQDPASPVAPPMRWTAASAHTPSPNVQATMQQMTEQLQTVIDAAERAAEAIRYDAEEQARRHLAEAQRKADRLTAERVGLISELTDDLVRHAANVRDHSEQMVRALEDAINSVTDKLEQPAMTDPFPGTEIPGPSLPFGEPLDSPPPPPPPAPETRVDAGSYTDLVGGRPPLQPAVPSDPLPAQPPQPPQPAQPAEPAEVPQEALLYATRLAIAGEDRETIANALRSQYGIADPAPIVDRMLGGNQAG